MGKNILRFDIETAPLYSSEEEMPDDMMAVRKKRYSSDKPDDLSDFERYFKRCSLFAEFSRIVCISMGYEKEVQGDTLTEGGLHHGGVEARLQITSIVGEEVDILEQFRDVLSKFPTDKWTLGGHNIKAFDVPFLAKRYVINGFTVPPMLVTIGIKPWDLEFVDTVELRKMGSSVSTGLETICIVLGVPTPKDAMDGSMVGRAFYDGKISEILTYCEKDVEAVYRCYKRMNRQQDAVDGCDELHPIPYDCVGIRCRNTITGIKYSEDMTRSQKLRFNRFIDKYHVNYAQCKTEELLEGYQRDKERE